MLQYALPLIVTAAAALLAWPLGRYLHWAMDPASPGPRRLAFEGLAGRLLGSASTAEQDWKRYSLSLLAFNLLMFLLAYVLLSCQSVLPLNPDGMANLEPSLAFHTAASFTTNTNLQHYSGEQSMSYFSQLLVLMWLQFVSAACGLAAAAALSRGLAGRPQLGNFLRDMWRALLFVLLPLALILAILHAACGVPMSLDGRALATTLEGASQQIARGPVAAMLAIKQLGTNGGGFFGPNCAHPYENPGFAANLLSNFAILLLPMATVWMFGRISGRLRHSAVLFGVMTLLFCGLAGSATLTESAPAAGLAGLPVTDSANLEGKELRFGNGSAAFWAVSTTATSNGSVNAMHESLNPLTGLAALAGMWLNVSYGGVGVGLLNMFIYVIIAVFISGLMVGRTPEYLARKLTAREVKLAALALLIHPLFILGGTALFAATPLGLATLHEPGSHGLSEIIYEFSSAAANNGSGFEGLADNTVPWNLATGIIMLLARFIPIIAPLAIAGGLAGGRSTPESSGTLRVDTALFGAVLLSVVLIVGALLFLPLAVLGPLAEQLALSSLPGGV